MSQEALFELHVTVHTPQGAFSGFLEAEPLTESEAVGLIDLMKNNTVNNMRLSSKDNPLKVTMFTKAVLERSVFTFELKPVAPELASPAA